MSSLIIKAATKASTHLPLALKAVTNESMREMHFLVEVFKRKEEQTGHYIHGTNAEQFIHAVGGRFKAGQNGFWTLSKDSLASRSIAATFAMKTLESMNQSAHNVPSQPILVRVKPVQFTEAPQASPGNIHQFPEGTELEIVEIRPLTAAEKVGAICCTPYAAIIALIGAGTILITTAEKLLEAMTEEPTEEVK